MGRTRIGWAAAIFAPWGLGFGLLVSLNAYANPDAGDGGLSMPTRSVALNLTADAKLIEANYVVGAPEELAAVPDEVEPRYAPKRSAAVEPVINRARKGDPFVALRPGFEAKAILLREPPRAAAPAAFGDGATPTVAARLRARLGRTEPRRRRPRRRSGRPYRRPPARSSPPRPTFPTARATRR